MALRKRWFMETPGGRRIPYPTTTDEVRDSEPFQEYVRRAKPGWPSYVWVLGGKPNVIALKGDADTPEAKGDAVQKAFDEGATAVMVVGILNGQVKASGYRQEGDTMVITRYTDDLPCMSLSEAAKA
jgi:hypothetical protein